MISRARKRRVKRHGLRWVGRRLSCDVVVRVIDESRERIGRWAKRSPDGSPIACHLSAFSADSSGELDILGHDGHAFGVDRAQVGVFKQTHQISLGRFLERSDGSGLKAKISLKILGNLADQPLEGELADQKLSWLLVPSDLSESNSSGTITVGLLHASGGWGALPGGLGGELLTRRFASSGLPCGLLRTGHDLTIATSRGRWSESMSFFFRSRIYASQEV